MKWLLNERLKHQIVGTVVLIALGVIFLPALLKESNYHLDEHTKVSTRMPMKPTAPKVSPLNEKTLFTQVKVAAPTLRNFETKSHLVALADAQPVQEKIMHSIASANTATMVTAAVKSMHQQEIVTAAIPKVVHHSKASTTVALNQPNAVAKVAGTVGYSLQLASFMQENNAQALVVKLRQKGYKANYARVVGKQGVWYKVSVSDIGMLDAAIHLQKQLASSMQLNGFIVKTGVS